MNSVKSGNATCNIYDVAVVGSGIGGLVAASLLARSGKRVLVLEKHKVAGGNVTSFSRRGYTFDVGLHYVGECGPGERLSNIFKACGIGDVEFSNMSQDLDEVLFQDFRFTIPATKSEFKRRLLERFPKEKRGIERYFKLLDQYEEFSRAYMTGSVVKIVSSVLSSPLLLHYARKTIGEFIETCTSNPKIKMILNARSVAYAVAPMKVSTILYTGIQCHYLKSGGWYPRKGTQNLSDRLVEEIKACGGDVLLECAVHKIQISNGRVTGVVFDNKKSGGHSVSTGTVVSNADFKRTVFDLVGREYFPARFTGRIEKFEMAVPLFVTFLGVDMRPEDLPYKNSNQWVVNGHDMDAYFASLESGEFPDDPLICISTPCLKSSDNPDIAPPGKIGFEIMTLVTSKPSFWGVSDEQIKTGEYRRNPQYRAVKQRIEDACIEQASRVIPGLKERIVHRESATPMTHTRYVDSTSGTGYGFAAIPSQFLQHRPGAKSPVAGLYFAGTNCQNGHGVIGAAISGVVAAQKITGTGTLKDIFCLGE